MGELPAGQTQNTPKSGPGSHAQPLCWMEDVPAAGPGALHPTEPPGLIVHVLPGAAHGGCTVVSQPLAGIQSCKTKLV